MSIPVGEEVGREQSGGEEICSGPDRGRAAAKRSEVICQQDYSACGWRITNSHVKKRRGYRWKLRPKRSALLASVLLA